MLFNSFRTRLHNIRAAGSSRHTLNRARMGNNGRPNVGRRYKFSQNDSQKGGQKSAKSNVKQFNRGLYGRQ